MQIRADQLVNGFVGVRDPAGQLFRVELVGQKTERLRIVVAGLQLALAVIDRAAIQPPRRAGFEACQLEAEPSSAPLMPAVVPSPARPPGVLVFAGVHERLQKRAGREDDGTGAIDRIAAHANAGDAGSAIGDWGMGNGE